LSAQVYDKIKYRGTDYGLAATPLEGYFSAHPEARPKFRGMNTSCMRGYVAQWEVRGEKLYLSGMEMVLQTDSTFETVFPGGAGGVFADWVSEDLVCPFGKMLKYDHAGFSRKMEHELILTVEGGIVKSEKTKTNTEQLPAAQV
jgi:hypothetical protein